MEVKRRAVVIEDLVDFQRFRDDKCRSERERTFLQNKITGEFMWRDPDWELVWAERRARSTLMGRVEEWQQFEDPATGRVLEYNAMTAEHRWRK
jgi:hypothetical protein